MWGKMTKLICIDFASCDAPNILVLHLHVDSISVCVCVLFVAVVVMDDEIINVRAMPINGKREKEGERDKARRKYQ